MTTNDAAQRKIDDAEARSAGWLGDYNEAVARGAVKTAETCLRKSQFWLDRANDLRGWGGRTTEA
ncbi:MAG TPA: hypothetical protein VHU42_18250 [Rhodopila sp.]|jgi:hypothetical protein|nr:hypothetical protein [Rhodopila sp.]